MVRPDYCAIDHLQTGVATPAVVEGFEEQLPQTGKRPTPELAINRRPFTEMLVQIAPGNPRSRNPEYPIKNKAVIPWAPPAERTPLNHKGRQTGPFLVAHQTSNHGSLYKSYLESETTPFGNPLCQQNLIAATNFNNSNILKLSIGGWQRTRTRISAHWSKWYWRG
jgi:hypothetical protein